MFKINLYTSSVLQCNIAAYRFLALLKSTFKLVVVLVQVPIKLPKTLLNPILVCLLGNT